ncbi:MAG TPA: glycosyl hydrolase family 8 [Buttiauxella sp.]|uniref:glycosyl hydrolase family 8 n=1 Tax=Buttiauxella sp. TaxID=1972222 RepID=UPI002B46B634|nr:glycosyl hydrolase family 8 [Buttiauxella sp.]HKM96181.1 glycosyl hydrolase family 8 [Buttiauxella sp.]
MLQRFKTLVVAMIALIFSQQALADTAWDSYKSRFLMPDGRIVDTGNKNVSHTEGQGFAMMMAVANDDRDSFDKMWDWTRKTLKNPETGLFYWRYNPVEAQPITDKNNAVDGDTFIAWALLKAGNKWQNPDYLKESDAITKALVAHNVVRFAGLQVMLPGAKGFNLNSYVNLNPSYFIFPAWQDFANRSHLTVWKDLISDGQKLLGKMHFGNPQLPSDWVSLYSDGRTVPAKEWPARFSYDAIRVPLYVYWFNHSSPELQAYKTWWGRYSRAQTPAWVNVATGETAPYMMEGGLLAVRDLVLQPANVAVPQITAQEDYYSASLKMLVALSVR